LEDNSGKLLIGTREGLNKFDPKTDEFTVYINDPQDPESLSHNNVRSIIEDSSGTLWIGTWQGGVNKFNPKTEKFTVYKNDPQDPESLSANGILSILEDKSGRLWIGTYAGGLNKFNRKTEKFTVYKNNPDDPNSLSGNIIQAILEDNSGKLWIGTREGLNKFDPKTDEFTVYINDQQDPESLSSNWVNSIFEDKPGNLWIGTRNGLNKLVPREDEGSPPTFIHYQHNPQDPESLSSNWVNSIIEDSSGTLWTSRWGLNKFDPKTEKFTVYPESLSNHHIITILEDKSGNIWISVGGSGLFKLNPKTEKLTIYEHNPQDSNSLSHNIVISIFEDSSGKLWIGTEAGWLNKLDPKTGKFTGYKHDPQDPESLSHNTVISIFEDSSGRLWFGTGGGGLNKFIPIDNEGPDRFIHYTTKDGLPDNTIHDLLEDDKGNIWISTGKGLSKFTPPKSPLKGGIQRGVFKNYSIEDLLQDIEFHGPTACKSKTGRMFFGGIKGFVGFFPDSIKDNSFIPPIVITKFKLFNESVFPGEDSPLKYSISATKEIELPYNQNFPSFEFAALNYSNPENNQYKYRMIGVDSDTVYAGTKRFAEYTDMRPGDYTFWVTGSNNDGLWNEEGTSIRIIIHPPWWKTKLAYALYIIAIILGIYAFIKFRERKLRKDKKVLEGKVKERTAEIAQKNVKLEQQKDEILTANEELNVQKEELQSTLENLKRTQSQLVESEKMAALGGLVAGVAHEINTPVGIGVTAISGLIEETRRMAELYKKEEISRADFKEYLSSTNNSAKLTQKNLERTASLVQSFKQVSVDQSSEQQREFLLKAYLEDVIRSLYPKFKRRDIEINIDCDEELNLNSYPGTFAQIFTNLVLNSITHGIGDKEKGKISINVRKSNGELEIEYGDDGKGIPEEILPKIFDPFVTSDQSKGTGLGLHIVYNLITQKLKGTIKCESKTGEGVKFLIKLPLA
ncbi:MAG: hypothetical protein KAX05_14800, partial [Bacteroidales bacterium]|nr:hypothetical protein [Bacteroidales bacterium]